MVLIIQQQYSIDRLQCNHDSHHATSNQGYSNIDNPGLIQLVFFYDHWWTEINRPIQPGMIMHIMLLYTWTADVVSVCEMFTVCACDS